MTGIFPIPMNTLAGFIIVDDVACVIERELFSIVSSFHKESISQFMFSSSTIFPTEWQHNHVFFGSS